MSNPKLEKVKEKMRLAKQKSLDPQIKSLIDSIEKAAVESAEKSLEAKLIDRVTGLVESIKAVVEKQGEDTQALIEFLEAQKQDYEDLSKVEREKLTGITDVLIDMAKELQKVKEAVKGQKYPELKVEYERIEKSFVKALDEVVKVLVNVNLEPNTVDMSYNTKGQLKSIVENYSSFTVTREIVYGRNGKIERITNTQS